MWMFYSFGLPMTLGMVIATLKFFAGPDVPSFVLCTVGYTWFCSLSIIVLVPVDIWTTLSDGSREGITFLWSWSYWSTFVLTWGIVPLLQGYEDSGGFSVRERLKTSIHVNLVFYLTVGSVGLFGVAILILLHKLVWSHVIGLAMACSNTFGLVTGAFLLGFGLIEIPRSIWNKANWQYRQKWLSHRIAKIAVNLDDAHQELSTAMVIAQATSNQMSRRDVLRPYMDMIDSMLLQMVQDDPSFKPSGGRIGESDMDYDADERSMATLRRRLWKARYSYCRFKSEYLHYLQEALELEDTIKNYANGRVQNWTYLSSMRTMRIGLVGSYLDTLEWIWRCIVKQQLLRFLAVTLGCMSAALLFAEATLLPNVDLSLFSLFIKAVGQQEILVQIVAFIPLMYMCACTYFSLFKLGTFTFYSLTPRYTSSVSLLMICSMVARYAPPISYNFLNLIRLGDSHNEMRTTFEKRMGKMDDAVPFFGNNFNKIYPLFMVIYTVLIASSFFDKIINLLGSWRKFRFENDDEAADGFNTSGLIILQKERAWLEQGYSLGENIVPLARNFNNLDGDIEAEAMLKRTLKVADLSGDSQLKHHVMVSEFQESNFRDIRKGTQNENSRNTYASKSTIAAKYFQEPIKSSTNQRGTPPSSSLQLLPPAYTSSTSVVQGTSISNTDLSSSRWSNMKSMLQDLKTNIAAKRFAPLRQVEENRLSNIQPSSSDTLEGIFANLRHKKNFDTDEDSIDLGMQRP